MYYRIICKCKQWGFAIGSCEYMYVYDVHVYTALGMKSVSNLES